MNHHNPNRRPNHPNRIPSLTIEELLDLLYGENTAGAPHKDLERTAEPSSQVPIPEGTHRE